MTPTPTPAITSMPTPTPKRYEYMTTQIQSFNDIQQILNRHAADGWRLTHIQDTGVAWHTSRGAYGQIFEQNTYQLLVFERERKD